MPHTGAQKILQTGLSSGMSATEGIHNKKLKPVDSSFDGLACVLPQDFIPEASSRITFRGKHHNVQMPYISWGAWSWGDTATWHWDDSERPNLDAAWQKAYQAGATWIDNAQAYSSGLAETIQGELLKGLPRESYHIQTKWYVVPDNVTNLIHPEKAPAKMLRETLKRLGVDYIDCYLVHGPIHASSIKQAAKGLAECVDSGMTRTVGVANYDVDGMIKMADSLSEYGIPLATNQCEYSVLRRLPETSGLLKACRERGIHFQSYSSLAQGRLTGKYTPEHEPPKSYRFSSYPMKDLQPTLKVLQDVAARHNKPMSAVALNYNISKGILPVVGFRKPEQVEANLQAFGWRLSNEEIKEIDSVSLEGDSTMLWQQG